MSSLRDVWNKLTDTTIYDYQIINDLNLGVADIYIRTDKDELFLYKYLDRVIVSEDDTIIREHADIKGRTYSAYLKNLVKGNPSYVECVAIATQYNCRAEKRYVLFRYYKNNITRRYITCPEDTYKDVNIIEANWHIPVSKSINRYLCNISMRNQYKSLDTKFCIKNLECGIIYKNYSQYAIRVTEDITYIFFKYDNGYTINKVDIHNIPESFGYISGWQSTRKKPTKAINQLINKLAD